MRIEGTYGPQPQDKPGLGPNPPAPRKAGQADAGQPASEPQAVQAQTAAYVQKARSAPEIDRTAVAAARQALESDQLDTAEAATRAAQILLDRGI